MEELLKGINPTDVLIESADTKKHGEPIRVDIYCPPVPPSPNHHVTCWPKD